MNVAKENDPNKSRLRRKTNKLPANTAEIVQMLELEKIDIDLYRGQQPAQSQLTRVYGGQVLAQALMAAIKSVDPKWTVHSLHAYFILGGDPSIPIVYDVERIRDGRSFATRRVAAKQNGQVIFYLTASFQVEEIGWEHQEQMPVVPPVEETPTMRELLELASSAESAAKWAEEWAAFEVRYIGDNRASDDPERARKPAVQRLWFKTKGEVEPNDPNLHLCLMTYISDLTLLGSTLVPHGTYIGSPKVQPASLDHTVWFHRPIRADQWHLYDQESPNAGGSRGLALGRIFSQDGQLVATVAQEGLIRQARKK